MRDARRGYRAIAHASAAPRVEAGLSSHGLENLTVHSFELGSTHHLRIQETELDLRLHLCHLSSSRWVNGSDQPSSLSEEHRSNVFRSSIRRGDPRGFKLSSLGLRFSHVSGIERLIGSGDVRPRPRKVR